MRLRRALRASAPRFRPDLASVGPTLQSGGSLRWAGPRLLGGAAAVLLAAASGCIFTQKVREAGLRYERPVLDPSTRSPIVAAYEGAGRTQFSVEYVAEIEGKGRARRWINFDVTEIRSSLPAGSPDRQRGNRWMIVSESGRDCTYVLSDDFVRQRIYRRPRWPLSSMNQLSVRVTDAAQDGAGQRQIGVSEPESPSRAGHADAMQIGVLADMSETPGRDVVVFSVPNREYRTWWGCAAQGLVPVTLAVDVSLGTAVVAVYLLGPGAGYLLESAINGPGK